MKKEIEIKVQLTEKEFNSLSGGGVFQLERTFGYFKDDFSNIKEGIFPRVKEILGEREEIILTVKVKTKENSNYFEREEFEVNIFQDEGVGNLRKILKLLGFSREIIFEKKRKNMYMDGLVVSFDVLPFGFFVEFEGEPEKIEESLSSFGLSGYPRITKAYLGLWEEYKKSNNINDDDCVFKE